MDKQLQSIIEGRKGELDLARRPMLSQMAALEESAVTCSGCPGTCCTFLANSMQITPLETLDLYYYLQENTLWNLELEEKLKKNIFDFRLDKRTGPGSGIRKSYTCPFFGAKELGCPLPPKVKPYGCLGFNPTEKGSSPGPEESKCQSSKADLIEREKLLPNEEGDNLWLKEHLGLYWEKESIPVALLDLHRILGTVLAPI